MLNNIQRGSCSIKIEREVKRVPMDFKWPLNKVWYGYQITITTCNENCDDCKLFAKAKGYKIDDAGCPIYPEIQAFEPPTGEGFQLWETSSEGSPQSPVFETLDSLCEWCAENATAYADFKASKKEWLKILIIKREYNELNEDEKKQAQVLIREQLINEEIDLDYLTEDALVGYCGDCLYFYEESKLTYESY